MISWNYQLATTLNQDCSDSSQIYIYSALLRSDIERYTKPQIFTDRISSKSLHKYRWDNLKIPKHWETSVRFSRYYNNNENRKKKDFFVANMHKKSVHWFFSRIIFLIFVPYFILSFAWYSIREYLGFLCCPIPITIR